jgi:hypothetical protein
MVFCLGPKTRSAGPRPPRELDKRAGSSETMAPPLVFLSIAWRLFSLAACVEESRADVIPSQYENDDRF